MPVTYYYIKNKRNFTIFQGVSKNYMKTESIITANKQILKKVAIANPKLAPFAKEGQKELDYRIARPLFVKGGHVYCTRCNELISEGPNYHACPSCGQLYTDVME